LGETADALMTMFMGCFPKRAKVCLATKMVY